MASPFHTGLIAKQEGDLLLAVAPASTQVGLPSTTFLRRDVFSDLLPKAQMP